MTECFQLQGVSCYIKYRPDGISKSPKNKQTRSTKSKREEIDESIRRRRRPHRPRVVPRNTRKHRHLQANDNAEVAIGNELNDTVTQRLVRLVQG